MKILAFSIRFVASCSVGVCLVAASIDSHAWIMCNFVHPDTVLVLDGYGGGRPDPNCTEIAYNKCCLLPELGDHHWSNWNIKSTTEIYYGTATINYGATWYVKDWKSGDPSQPYNGKMDRPSLDPYDLHLTGQNLKPVPRGLAPLPDIVSTQPDGFCLATKGDKIIGTNCADSNALPGFEDIKIAGYSRDGLQWSGLSAHLHIDPSTGHLRTTGDYAKFYNFNTVTNISTLTLHKGQHIQPTT